MANIVFMGTPDFAVPALQALLETHRVVGVVTQPDRPAGRGRRLRPSPVKLAAAAAGVPLYQPRTLRPPEAAEPLRAWDPDLIVVAAFGQILRPHVLDLPRHGCLNVHASLLPRWRGASPIQHAILAGDDESGVSLMQMEIGLDTGPVFVSRRVPLRSDETAATLHDRLAALGGELLREYLPAILDGSLQPVPQDDNLSTYAPLIEKDDGRLDWSASAEALDRRIRAMTPWPGAFTTWEGRRLKIVSGRPVSDPASMEPGTVQVRAGTVQVAAGSGALLLEKVQPAGKPAMTAAAFVNGRPEFVGACLGADEDNP